MLFLCYLLLARGVLSLHTMAGFWEGTESFVDGTPPSKTVNAALFLDDQGS